METEKETEKESHPGKNVADKLRLRKDDIIRAWLERIRNELPAAREERDAILTDTIPEFLSNLAAALAEDEGRNDAVEKTTLPTEHGMERARATKYSVTQVVHEIQILRIVLFQCLESEGPLLPRERNIILHSMEREIREAVEGFDRIQEEQRNRLMKTLGHDMRNPLSTIRMSADFLLLLDAQAAAALKDEIAGRMLRSVERIDAMLTDLLEVGLQRVVHDLPLDFVRADLRALVEQAIEDFHDRPGGRQVRLLPGEPVECFFDAQALRRVVDNLIGNALKHGRPEQSVEVGVWRRHGRAVLSVHNEGPVIPEGELMDVFEPFRRGAVAREAGREGWGIGLAFVKAMAEAHGGSIVVDSAEERGTTFSLHIPMDADGKNPQAER